MSNPIYILAPGVKITLPSKDTYSQYVHIKDSNGALLVDILEDEFDELFVLLDEEKTTKQLDGIVDWLFDQGVMYVEDNAEKDINPAKVKEKVMAELKSVLGFSQETTK